MSACEPCLRRAYLVAELAPRIAGLLGRPGERGRALLALGDEELVHAVAGRRAGALRQFLEGFDPRRARSELAVADVAALCRHDDGFPVGLRPLPDAPAVLFAAGATRRLAPLSEGPAATLVGTRRASQYGIEMAYGLGRWVGAAGLPVVSGLAIGVDAAAHRGCLDGCGFPVAVLAGGPDVAYPRRNRPLYERVRRGGLVLSELPPGRRAFRWSFPARNRIMAALGAITVVVEAANPSGSLITAEYAQDLGRTVGAVPGRATSRMAAGSNGLLRDGAAVIRSAQDVLDELLGPGARLEPQEPQEPPRQPDDPTLRAALAAVEAGQDVDGVASACGLGAAATRAALARLELEGYLARRGLGAYVRTAGGGAPEGGTGR